VQIVNAFMSNVCGNNWRQLVDDMVPGAAAAADQDAANHALTSPALLAWRFTSEVAKAMTMPVLGVVGQLSSPVTAQRRTLLNEWLPQMETLDVEGTNHLMHLHNPQSSAALAEGMAAFFRSHPISQA
jgi:pimeloyl-ACP methyl ester carboxylesterase